MTHQANDAMEEDTERNDYSKRKSEQQRLRTIEMINKYREEKIKRECDRLEAELKREEQLKEVEKKRAERWAIYH